MWDDVSLRLGPPRCCAFVFPFLAPPSIGMLSFRTVDRRSTHHRRAILLGLVSTVVHVRENALLARHATRRRPKVGRAAGQRAAAAAAGATSRPSPWSSCSAARTRTTTSASTSTATRRACGPRPLALLGAERGSLGSRVQFCLCVFRPGQGPRS